MRNPRSLIIGLLGLLCAACANLEKPSSAAARDALAPTGKLRLGFLVTAPTHATADPVTGELRGPSIELGREIAGRLGVPLDPVTYTSISALLAGANAGEWDIATMGITDERRKAVDFTSPYMVVEFSYLVPDGSSIVRSSDIDREGVRIAVLEKSLPDSYLSRSVSRATLVRLPALAEMMESLRSGKVDAVYAVKATMLAQSGSLPGSRVLEGSFGGEETAIAVPKARHAGAAYAREFVEAAKSDGIVKAMIERAALPGVVVFENR